MPKKNHRKVTAAYPFPSDGKGLIFKDQPIGVRFPPAISNYLRQRKNAKGEKDTQDFVRAAVAEKIARDGIDVEASIEPTPPPATTETKDKKKIISCASMLRDSQPPCVPYNSGLSPFPWGTDSI